MIERLKSNPLVRQILNNKLRLGILTFTVGLHVVLLVAVTIDAGKKQNRAANDIFKMVDVQEYIPMIEDPDKPKDQIDVQKQDDVVENITETDKEINELDVDYLPMHKISKAPGIPYNTIRSRVKYPALAKKQGIEAKVILMLYIDGGGHIREVKALNDPGYGFAEAATASHVWDGLRVPPAQANGIPVAVMYRWPIVFRLK